MCVGLCDKGQVDLEQCSLDYKRLDACLACSVTAEYQGVLSISGTALDYVFCFIPPLFQFSE